MTLSINDTLFCHYAECRVLFIVMLNVKMLSVIIMSVIRLGFIRLNVVMLSVVAPSTHTFQLNDAISIIS